MTIFLALLIYMNDIIITETSVDVITHVKNALHLQFTIKNLGLLEDFFGT